MKPEYEDELMGDYRAWKQEREQLARSGMLVIKGAVILWLLGLVALCGYMVWWFSTNPNP